MERPALTTLGEEESLFRATVRAFAEERLRPLAAEMDREGKLHPEVISWLFELGLMGIEIPESWGGAGASFFMSVLAIEELARVDPSVAVVYRAVRSLTDQEATGRKEFHSAGTLLDGCHRGNP